MSNPSDNFLFMHGKFLYTIVFHFSSVKLWLQNLYQDVDHLD